MHAEIIQLNQKAETHERRQRRERVSEEALWAWWALKGLSIRIATGRGDWGVLGSQR